jgi:hypothetical protein
MRALHRLIAVAVGLVLLAGCGGRLSPPAEGPGGLSAAVAVDRFLQLAANRDYVQMGWVFGNENGPIIREYPRPEVEQRMYAIATVLQHDSFVVGPGSPVPGRIGAAEQFTVKIYSGASEFDVPFVVVRGPGNRWFVEQVDLQAVTSIG